MKYIVKCLIIFGLSTGLFSASFNCDLAGLSEVENKICGNFEISTLDERLSEWYKLLIQSDSGYLFRYVKPDLKVSQRVWLSVRNNCADYKCLKEAYNSRIDELKSSYLNFRRFSSDSFIERILKNLPIDGSDDVAVEEVISFTLNEFGIAQYLFKTYQGYGGNPNGHCGSGAYRGFWYIEFDTSNDEVVNSDSVVYGDCGANVASLSYKIESAMPLVVKMFVKKSTDEEPVKYFQYSIRYHGSNEFFRLVQE